MACHTFNNSISWFGVMPKSVSLLFVALVVLKSLRRAEFRFSKASGASGRTYDSLHFAITQ